MISNIDAVIDPLLVATGVSFVAFPIASVYAARRIGKIALAGLWVVWLGSLLVCWSLYGAPEAAAIWIGVPFTAAAVRAYMSPVRDDTLGIAVRRTLTLTGILFLPCFLLGLWLGIAFCQGGCL
jgi:hypothetical protein